MTDSLLDDVTSLLEGDFGDDRILKQIARACKNNEAISNYERNYVQKLAEQYLGKKAEIPSSIEPEIESSIQNQTLQSQVSRSPGLKNPKLILGFGGVALVIIIVAAVAFSSNSDFFTSDPKSEIQLTLTIQTDLSSYSHKDIISISGTCTNSEIVNLSIKNEKNNLVWAEQLSIKNNGKYSTLAIAAGSGWENSGTYTVTVDSGSEIKLIKFSFTS
tara:strand:- start:735 stop:1385 length:651 start_codon:yes stop_codon:yes gene_type:complete